VGRGRGDVRKEGRGGDRESGGEEGEGMKEEGREGEVEKERRVGKGT